MVVNKQHLLELGADVTPDEMLGYFLSWQAHPKLLIRVHEMATLLDKHHLTDLVELPDGRLLTNTRRTVEAMADAGVITRRPLNSTTRTMYALVKEGMKNDDEPEYNLASTIILEKPKDGPPRFTFLDGPGTPQGETEARFNAWFHLYATSFTGRDVTHLIFCETIMGHLNGLRLRTGGGFYFVLASEYDTLEKLGAFAKEVAATYELTCDFLPFRVIANPDERAAIGAMVVPTLLSDVNEAVTELKKMQSGKRKGSVKGSTIRTHIDHALTLRTKAEMLAEMLGADISKIQAAITDLVAGLEAIRAPAAPILKPVPAPDPLDLDDEAPTVPMRAVKPNLVQQPLPQEPVQVSVPATEDDDDDGEW